MYLIVAKNHDKYEEFLHKNFKYVGDEKDIERIDPARVRKIIFAEGYEQHPVYFSDAFLKLQFEVAAHNVVPRPPKKKWWKKW